MYQFHWTYWDRFGQRHVVGILHGIKTGHLVIHLNSKILIIDFNVQHAKKYSFLINEELCELQVQEKNEGYSYDLEVNEKQLKMERAQRRKEEKRIFLERLGIVFIVFTFISILSLFVSCLQN